MDTIKYLSKETKTVAHRGASGIERENTAAAFVAAGNRSYFGVETDVHVTKDGKYVIIHDDDTERVAEVKLCVEETEFSVLRGLRLKDKFGYVREDLCLPSLEEYLRICKTYDKVCVLELKNAMSKEDVTGIYETVCREYAEDKVIFISFDYQNLVYLRELCVKSDIQFLTCDEVNSDLIAKLKAYNFNLDIYFERLTEENIKLLHDNGVEVNCWTVDDKSWGEKLASWGVDYITSNILE